MPAIVTIGNGPSSGDGTYINAADLAAQLAAGAVAIAADASIVIETSVDLSLFAGSTVAGNLTLQAPNIHVSGNVQVGTGSVILNATSLALGGTFSSDGSPLPGARLTGTATSVSVLSDAANIQQAIDASNFNTPVTINVASGDYVGAVTVSHALSLIGAPAAAGVGANASAPRLTFNPATGGDLISVQVANVTISGFVLDATGSSGPTNGIGGTAINLDITTNNFIGFSFAGVLHLFANDVLIQANYFERIQSDAIREVAGAGVVVRGNVVEGNAAGEFGAGRYGIFVGDSFGAQIVDNVVRGVNGGAGAGQVGIYSFNVDGGVISGNVVAGLSGGRGSFLHDYDFSRTDGATITNNTVDSDGNAGSIAAGQTNIMTPAFAAFREDTGVSGDGVSNNGLIDVTLAPTATSWRYSTDGGATWTVGVGASFTLAAGTYAAGAIQVDQSDANGNTNSAYQLGAITILSANTPPVSNADTNTTGEDTAVLGNVLTNDTDANAGDVLTVTAVNGVAGAVGTTITLASGALLTLNANGTYSYNPNGRFEHLGVGESASDSFSYTISDGNGGSSSAAVNITINGVNDAPTVVTIGNGPSSGDGTYINAADLAAQLAAGAVAIAADASIVIEVSVDLSLFAGSPVAGNLTLQAPSIQVLGAVQVGAGSVTLNATSLALGGTFLSSGSPLAGARLTGTATNVSVLSDAANIQQAIEGSSFNAPVTINVASGDYVGALYINHSLSLIGASGTGVGAGPGAPVLTHGSSLQDSLILVDANNIEISGFALVGSSNTLAGVIGAGNDLFVHNNTFSNFDFAGISHFFSLNVVIEDNYFERIGFDAISVISPGPGLVVRGNIVEGNTTGEFGAGRYGIFVADSQGVQITDNVVRGVNGGTGAGDTGIYVSNVDASMISDNLVAGLSGGTGAGHDGISAFGSDGGAITGNVVAGLSGGRGSLRNDFLFQGNVGTTLTNNIVDSDGVAGSAAASQTNIMAPAFAVFREDTGVAGDGISANGLIDVTLAANATSWRYSTDGGATWTVGVGASFALAPGSYAAGVIQVDQSDANGNTNSAYQLGAITVLDEALPPPTAALSQDTGISGTDGITSRDLINVTLAAEAVTWQYSTDGGSTWILGQGDSFALPEGVYEAGFVRVRQADATGVYGESFGLGAVTIDQTVGSPFATLFRDTGVDGDGLTANPLVTVNLAGDVLTWRYSTDGSATWTAGVGTTSWNAGSGAHFFLTDGVYSAGTILVEQTDIAGNVSSPFALSPITVDLQPPTISGSLANDTGSQGDGITSDGRINVSFSAGTTLWYYSIDGGANWTTVTDTSVRSFVVPIGVYSPGSVQLLATEVTGLQSDAFSIAGPIIVLAAPTASVAISAISEDTGTVGDFITSDRTLTVSGSNSALGAFERIEISTDDGATWANVTMTQDGLGWSYVDSVTHNTTFTYTVRAVNAAGGVGNSVSQGITILNGVILTGTAGSNTLTGTEFSDTLRGLAGADTLIGGRGNDLLDGGADNDRFLYTIGDGGDTIIGGAGTDRLIITDTAGPDFLQVTVVGNRITGINDNSSGLMGTISGVEIVNLTVTGPGDFLNYGPSLGPITVDLQTRTATGFTTITGLQNVQGGFGDDRLFGNASDNLIYGGNGADRIEGRRGNDTMSGLEGNDTLVYNVGDGDDYIDGGEGIDTLQILGTASADRVDISLINWFTGPAVFRLQGGYVDPTMEVVTLNMGDGVDTLSYASTASPSAVAVTVNLQAATATGFTSIAGVENVVGGNGADTLIGNGANNQLSGGAGADVLRGFGGNDVLTGGGGDDTLSGGVGNDRFVFRSGDGRDTITDFVAGAASGDTIQLLGYGPNLDSFAEVRAATFQVGANTVIDLGNGELITLIGVNAATLNAGDFVFGP